MSENQATTPNGIVPAASAELSFYERIQQKKMASEAILSVEDFSNKLASLDEAVAESYISLFHTIRPLEKGDRWRPLLMSIASKKGNDEAFKNAGAGGLFINETKKAVAKGTLFFPLFSHEEHTWWQDSKAICRSIDGVKGQRFKGPNSPGIIACGTNCPNTPTQFQKSEDPCKWTMSLYLVDSNLTNIYSVPLKYFGVDKTYGLMLKSTKKAGTKFDTAGANWFTLGTFEKGTSPQKMGWYYEARETDEALKPAQVLAIDQLKALVREYHRTQVSARDNVTQVAAGVIDQIETAGVIEENSDFSNDM